MQHTRIAVLIAFGGILWIACSSRNESARGATEKPRNDIGGEALVFPASAALPEDEGVLPAAHAIELRAYSVSPVGPIREEARTDYRIYIEVENTGDVPLRLTPSFVRAIVMQGQVPVSGCVGETLAVRDHAAVGRSGALFVSVPLPCTLEAGNYDLDLTFAVGAPPGLGDAIVERNLKTELIVDATLPPYASGFLPPE
jgi:hypothetical protein